MKSNTFDSEMHIRQIVYQFSLITIHVEHQACLTRLESLQCYCPCLMTDAIMLHHGKYRIQYCWSLNQ